MRAKQEKEWILELEEKNKTLSLNEDLNNVMKAQSRWKHGSDNVITPLTGDITPNPNITANPTLTHYPSTNAMAISISLPNPGPCTTMKATTSTIKYTEGEDDVIEEEEDIEMTASYIPNGNTLTLPHSPQLMFDRSRGNTLENIFDEVLEDLSVNEMQENNSHDLHTDIVECMHVELARAASNDNHGGVSSLRLTIPVPKMTVSTSGEDEDMEVFNGEHLDK